MELDNIIGKYSVKSSSKSKKLSLSTFTTPVGTVIAAADEELLYLVSFEDSKNLDKKLRCLHDELNCSYIHDEKNKILLKLKLEMSKYFDGKLKKFTVPLGIVGSDFQKEVWHKLQEIPFGSTQSYGDLAKEIGRPGSARAVGAACGANAHLLIIPCHRLVAANSKGGFSSGVDRKEWLIDHEKKKS